MDLITDPKQAGERLLAFAREGRLVQGAWHRVEDGREIACLLGAAAGIDDAKRCPASLMPAWVALALTGLFDGQSESHAIAFAIRWGEAMVRDEWRRIDWDAVRNEWMAFVVQQAQAAAASASIGAKKYAADAEAEAADAEAAAADAEAAAAYAASAAADASNASHAADAAYAAYAAARAAYADAYAAHAACTAHAAQADALMAAIERAMEVARG
ncbi:MAG: hypothetical protein ACK539_13745 [Planctomycetota bacterium]